MAVRDLWFDGLSTPVRTVDCEETLEGLAAYIPCWPFSHSEMSDADPCAVLAYNGTAWLIQSPHTDAPRVHKTDVNAVCDLLSILASALIAQDPQLLCFHAAALEGPNGLILFPALRRSGKSTLAAELMARGYRLFTDDYLPVDWEPDHGVTARATGIAARLRMPLPETLSARAAAFISGHPGPENRQYRYLAGPMVAPHGTPAAISTIVLLDRQDTGPAQIAPVTEGETLARLAKQNFSRGRPAGETLCAMIDLIGSAASLSLTYSDPGEAADLILAGLPGGTGRSAPVPEFPTPGPRPDPLPLDLRRRYQTTPFADLRAAGDVWVGPSCEGNKILQFDAASVGLLELLAEPQTPRALVSLISEAFPQTDRALLQTRTYDALRRFLKVGYIARVQQ